VDWSRYHLQILFVDHSDQLRAKLAAAFFEQASAQCLVEVVRGEDQRHLTQQGTFTYGAILAMHRLYRLALVVHLLSSQVRQQSGLC
jgi:hypothetical protein